MRKRYQLSERLADLFDQYQVYRADWLEDWAEGRHQLRNVRGEVKPLPSTSCWQAELWRALLEDVGEQGMLREHAFDSGSLFTQTLETDHSDLLGEVLRDYWRLFCYPMQGDALNWVRSHWGGPAALLPRVRALFGTERDGAQGRSPAELIEECLQERRAALVELKKPWQQWADELLAICHQGVASKTVDGRKIQARYFESWFEKLKTWAGDESEEQLDIGTGFTRLTPEGMNRRRATCRSVLTSCSGLQ